MTSASASSLPKNLHSETSPPVLDPSHKFLGAQLINKAKGSGSSRLRAATHEPLEKLPLLRGIPQYQFDACFACHSIVILPHQDAKAADREDLFIRKLRQCSQVFDFTDPLGDLKACLYCIQSQIYLSYHLLCVCSRRRSSGQHPSR